MFVALFTPSGRSLVASAVAAALLSLTPGQYAMVCFLPDVKDGKPHHAHGMIKAFTVS